MDKHFDQLLAQQRELITDYFRQSGTTEPGVAGPRDGQDTETDAAHPELGAAWRPSPVGAGRRGRPRRATARMVNPDERPLVIAVLGLGEPAR